LRRGGHRPSMGRSAAAHRKNKIGAPPGRNQLNKNTYQIYLDVRHSLLKSI
jgi:hypothetical protein